MQERTILSKLMHPTIVRLFYTFQDESYLYLCMELVPGGELLDLIRAKKDEKQARGIEGEACDMQVTRFYTAEIILALEYMHSQGVVHRDLKPENILITETGHIKITDFGTSLKEDSSDPDARHNSFVGTADYVSPEVLQNEEASKACDLWAVGCMAYQMLVGRPPFRADSEYLTFQEILHHCDGTSPLQFPPCVPEEARDLISKLLAAEPAARLGAGEGDDNGYPALKAHPAFESVDWDTILSSEAPYRPDVSALDMDNMMDGATDDWLLEGDATPIMLAPIAMEEANDEDSKWRAFLQPGEALIQHGLLWKRKGLFSKRRQLILTDTPRLFYVDPETMVYKGEIHWTKEEPVQPIQLSETAFDVAIRGRTYHFTDSAPTAKQWVESISSQL